MLFKEILHSLGYNEHSVLTNSQIGHLSTGEPRYPRSFYLRIRLFTFEILLKRAKFLFKMCPFYLRIQYSRSKRAGRIYRE
jgi:hypothetical protein